MLNIAAPHYTLFYDSLHWRHSIITVWKTFLTYVPHPIFEILAHATLLTFTLLNPESTWCQQVT